MSTELIAEIELPSDQIRAVRLVAGRIAMTEGFDDEVVEDVKLAVGEACSRVAAAGNEKIIRVRFQRQVGTLLAEFPGFPSPPEQVPPGGLGAVAEGSEIDFSWLILNAVAPDLGLDGGTLRLVWPLPHVGAPHA